jgi:hypothetical protein
VREREREREKGKSKEEVQQKSSSDKTKDTTAELDVEKGEKGEEQKLKGTVSNKHGRAK